jgi:hypothetical protein
MNPLSCITLLAVSLLSSICCAQVQTDARDYDTSNIPNRTVIAAAYFRHLTSSGTRSATINLAIFRTVYVLKFGNLAVAPINGFLPVADVTAYAPSGMPRQSLASHTSGVGDLTFLPSVVYDFPQPDGSHTYTGFTLFVTAPTGSYSSSRRLNVGENRWVTRFQAMVGQRFLKRYTAEAIGYVSIFSDNDDFRVSPTGTQTLQQKPSMGLNLHLAADVSPAFYLALSYYLEASGLRHVDAITGEVPMNLDIDERRIFSTLRFTSGIRVMPQLLLLVQYNTDVSTTGDAQLFRFWGTRLSYLLL